MLFKHTRYVCFHLLISGLIPNMFSFGPITDDQVTLYFVFHLKFQLLTVASIRGQTAREYSC